MDLIRQKALNVAISNADTRAKTYTIRSMATECGSPTLRHSLDDALGRTQIRDPLHAVNGVYDPWEVTLADWRAEARHCGLNPDTVEEIVRDVTMHLVEADYDELPSSHEVAHEIEGYVHECTRNLLPNIR